jgi:hypothetical protein
MKSFPGWRGAAGVGVDAVFWWGFTKGDHRSWKLKVESSFTSAREIRLSIGWFHGISTVSGALNFFLAPVIYSVLMISDSPGNLWFVGDVSRKTRVKSKGAWISSLISSS